MKDHPTEHLDVKVAQTQDAFASFADYRKCFGEQVVEEFFFFLVVIRLLQSALEFCGFPFELLVTELLHFFFEQRNLSHDRLILFQFASVGIAK